MSTAAATARQALDAYTKAFTACDHDAVADLFADTCLVEIPLIDRPLRSQRELREEIRIDLGGLEDVQITYSEIVEQDNLVLAEGRLSAYVLGGFETFEFRFVAVMEVDETGRITRLSEYFDTREVKPSQRMKVHGPPTRISPYWDGAQAAGQQWFIVYNHMYFPLQYRNTPYSDYVALTERVALWDVGCERQTELRGPDAIRLADYICTRDFTKIDVGMCRYTMVCDPEGRIMNDPVVLRPWSDVVWISHGDVDITLWARGIALSQGWDVEVHEPDVAPVQVQGPRSLDVLRPLVQSPLDDLGFYRCVATKVGGIDAVVSRTGWSGGLGYEVYPLSSEHAMDLWSAILEAGGPHGIRVQGANIHTALERNVVDMACWLNFEMNPYEAGLAQIVDLNAEADFIGKEALKEVHRAGPKRQTVGLVFDGRIPRMEIAWDLTDAAGREGKVRWANFSFGLRQFGGIALVEMAVNLGDRVTVDTRTGTVQATVVELPLVR
jgi:glycine cleavage system aminomethyltransferase T/limonene-1,2-epoxide hydrolase